MRDARARLAVLASAVALAGCGGGERQDAGAPEGAFEVEVTEASFPQRQRVADAATLRLEVANRGDRAVPDLAVTVETGAGADGVAPAAFGARSAESGQADSERPVWVVDEAPAGSSSTYVNTWATGPLDPGQTRTVQWRLTPVKPGRYTVAWRLAPALVGAGTIQGDAAGELAVTIDDEPVPATVGRDGDVVRGDG